MPNAWVIHVRKFAQENNKSYACAISDPLCKSSYKKPVKQKTSAQERKGMASNDVNAPQPEKVIFKKKRARAPPPPPPPPPEPEKVIFKKKRARAPPPPPPPPKILLIKDAPPKKVRRTWAEGYETLAMKKHDIKPEPIKPVSKAQRKLIKKVVGTGILSKQELNSLGLD